MARSLKKIGIPIIFWPQYSFLGHIYGVVPDLKVIPVAPYVMDRLQKTFGLISETIRTFPNELYGKELDIWMQFTDGPLEALNLAQAIDLPYVFAYYTSHTFKNKVIAIPDYVSCYKEENFHDLNRSPIKCKEVAAKKWQINKIFWRGSLFTNSSRRFLFELGKKYPQYLQIEDSTRGQFVPMIEQAKYKYLIDLRGFAGSDRIQTLLQLGRVVFIAERPFREWYFDRLIPMKHYVPVKEDMSDLLDKYFYMEHHPELYEKIVRNLAEFVEENFNPRRILFDTKELLLKYGVVQK